MKKNVSKEWKEKKNVVKGIGMKKSYPVFELRMEGQKRKKQEEKGDKIGSS